MRCLKLNTSVEVFPPAAPQSKFLVEKSLASVTFALDSVTLSRHEMEAFMGRKPIGKKPMTPAERQRRHRKRLKTTRSAEVRKKLAAKARDNRAMLYVPMPPGITVWRKVRIKAGEEVEIWQPKTRPLAAVRDDLTDDDLLALLRDLRILATERGLSPESKPSLGKPFYPGPGECVTVGRNDLARLVSDDTP